MSFDVNPLGTQMHLNQLEREVKQQQLFQRIGEDRNRCNPDETASRKSWVAWFTETITMARHAG